MKRFILLILLAMNATVIWSQVYPALIPYKAKNDMWGYCDTAGKLKIVAKFDTVKLFNIPADGSINNPAAWVMQNKIEQIIDTSGRVIVPGGFKALKEIVIKNNLFFLATTSDYKRGVYLNGDTIVQFKYTDIKWKINATDSSKVIFDLKKGSKSEQITFSLPTQKKQPKPASLKQESPDHFQVTDVPELKGRLKLDSIRFIENGLAYVEKGKKSGFLIKDKIILLNKNYTIINANLLEKYSEGCATHGSKLLVTIQEGDKYILMDEHERNLFNQEFTDTEGNDEYVVVKDYKRIGFFSKNTCYPIIPTKYDKFIDPLKIKLSSNSHFLIYRVLLNGKEVLVGQNGAEYFSNN